MKEMIGTWKRTKRD